MFNSLFWFFTNEDSFLFSSRIAGELLNTFGILKFTISKVLCQLLLKFFDTGWKWDSTKAQGIRNVGRQFNETCWHCHDD